GRPAPKIGPLREKGAWRRPTLPPLERQYHRRGGFSRPSSGWDRVLGPSLWPPGFLDRTGEGGQNLSVAPLPSGERKRVVWAACVFGRECAARPWLGHGAAVVAVATRGRRGSCRWMGAGAFERLVPVGCAGCPASTSGLSTWWSTTALDETWF